MKAKRPTQSRSHPTTSTSSVRLSAKAQRANYRGDAVQLLIERFPRQPSSQEDLIRLLPRVVEKRDMAGIRAILKDAAGPSTAGSLLGAFFQKK